MIILKTVESLTRQLAYYKEAGCSIGFVPTMGALHDGHISLLRTAQQKADITVCSIFVNPTQFNDPEDFKKYPVTTDQDIALLIAEKVDVLFLPEPNEVYPKDLALKQYDLGEIEFLLEGAHRPGHFQGVAQVLDRLLNIIQPTFIIMGQKDFQQVMIVKRLLDLTRQPTKLISSPTLREPSGLARSSRNTRLTPEERQKAAAIHSTLLFGKEHIIQESPRVLENTMSNQLLSAGFKAIDYVSICHSQTLLPIEQYKPGMDVVILIAAFIGEVRLIDNMKI